MIGLAPLLESGGLSEVLRAVNSHFRKGGSTTSVVAVLIIIAGVIFTTWLISRILKPRRRRSRGPDPQAVFQKLAKKLGLTEAEKDVINRLSHLADVHQPTTILLSRKLFERQIRRIDRGGNSPSSTNRSPISPALVDGLRVKLFADRAASDDLIGR